MNIEPPIVETILMNRYSYTLDELKLHTSVKYNISLYKDEYFVKYISGIIEGEQYKEWTTDDWMDAFIKSKVENLTVV